MAANRLDVLPLVMLAGACLLFGCDVGKVPPPGGLVAAPPAQPAGELNSTSSPAGANEATAASEPLPPAADAGLAAPGSELPPSAPPAAASIPIVASPGLIPVDVASSGGIAGGTPQPAAGQPPVPSRRTASVRLSAGIAVPQSLPMGTVMAMSVDYQIGGPLDNSSKYVWVVASQGGGVVEVPMPRQPRGTLQAFFLELRPEHRPFNSHIDEISPGGRRTRVSNVATMQTSY